MNEGELIEFRLHGERRLAVVERPEGKKHWVVVDEQGRSVTIHPRQATYTVPGGPWRSSQIAGFRAAVTDLVDPDALELAWEMLVEEGTGATAVETLAELLYSAAGAEQCYAAHTLLVEDPVYFKAKGEHYEPRSEAQVEELRHQIEVTRQREEAARRFSERLVAAIDGQQQAWEPEERQRIESIERFALQGRESPNHGQAMELLAGLERNQDEAAAREVLIAIGHWERHENLALLRSDYPRSFPADQLELADRLIESAAVDREGRSDQTGLKVFAIDDHHTREIDDAVGIERLGSGAVRVWIHVADPARLIQLDDPLDLAARERATTLYLPTGMLSMFPFELAAGPMSLRAHEECESLAFGVDLDEEGAISDYRICRTLIRPAQRMTYEEVDEALAGEADGSGDLVELQRIATLRAGWRERQGAMVINTPEATVRVVDDEVEVTPCLSTPARSMVAEMMILAGEVAARYGMEHQLPLPYRGQPAPQIPQQELDSDLASPMRDYALRRFMSRTQTLTDPAPHAGLGLPAYVQATSPIRRYGDLLAHYQIKAQLAGEAPPLDQAALAGLLPQVGELARNASLVERQTRRYWILEYLRRNRDTVYPALLVRVLRPDLGLALLLLETLGVELTMTFKKMPPIGTRFDVTVAQVDPWSDTIRLQRAG